MKNIIVIALVFSLYGCTNKPAAEEKKETVPEETVVTLTEAHIKNAGIETGKAETRTMSTVLKVNGTVDVPPQNLISVSFPLGGFLKNTKLLPGMKISKGEVIAVMENEAFIQLEQDYLTAKSKLEFMQKEYERQKLLNSTKSTSDKVFEQTQSEFQSLKIAVNGLSEKLLMIGVNPEGLNENNISRTVNITSPINGYVSVVNVNIGKYVEATDVLFELVNPADLHLALTVFEKDLPAVHIGQKVKATLSGNIAQVFEADIILIGKKLDDNRSAIVHCHFTNPGHDLLPGMFLNAGIDVTSEPGLVLPEDAVVGTGDKHYVFIEKPNKQFELTEVTAGVTQDGWVQISSGTELTDKVFITKNAYAAYMKLQNKAE